MSLHVDHQTNASDNIYVMLSMAHSAVKHITDCSHYTCVHMYMWTCENTHCTIAHNYFRYLQYMIQVIDSMVCRQLGKMDNGYMKLVSLHITHS